MENTNKREKQRLERRQQILNCSLDMIISRGFEAMKIRDIANRLNISTGLFFNYFESKEQVYEELVKIGLSGPAGVLEMNVLDIAPMALFEKMAEAVLGALKADAFTGKMFLLMSQAMQREAVSEKVKQLLEGFDPVTPLLPILQKGQALGQIKQGDPIALIMTFWGAVQGVAQNYALDTRMPLPESSWIADILRAR
jgi:AcrR family transcriptional regulator